MTARRAHTTCSHPEKHPFSHLQQAWRLAAAQRLLETRRFVLRCRQKETGVTRTPVRRLVLRLVLRRQRTVADASAGVYSQAYFIQPISL